MILEHCPKDAEVHFHDESEDIYDENVVRVTVESTVNYKGVVSTYAIIAISES
jgi:hypothetical protein|nr:MAG TPA: hypothetical protein [Bacteriophage sp.]